MTAGLIFVTPPMWTDDPESSIHAWEIQRGAIDNITYDEQIQSVSDAVFIDANMFAPVNEDNDLPLEEHDFYSNKIHGFIAWDLTWPGKVPAGFNPDQTPSVLRLFIPLAMWGDHTGLPVAPIPQLNFRWLSAAELEEMFPPIDAHEFIFYPPVVSPFGYVPSSLITPHFSVGFDDLAAAEGDTLEIPLDGTGYPGGTFFGLRMWITNLDPVVIGFDQWGFAFMMVAMADRDDDGVRWHGPQLGYGGAVADVLALDLRGALTLRGALQTHQERDALYHRARLRRG